jgi:hypothetical protein
LKAVHAFYDRKFDELIQNCVYNKTFISSLVSKNAINKFKKRIRLQNRTVLVAHVNAPLA